MMARRLTDEERSLHELLATRPTSAEHAIELAEGLYTFSVRQQETDFKFKVGNNTAHCHSPVLCVQSPYFNALCSRGAREATLNQCMGERRDGKALTQTVRFLYLGTMDLTPDIVEPVVKSAQHIQHQKMLEATEQYMMKMLKIGNFQTFADVARRYALRKVNKACEELQTNEFSAMLYTRWFLPSLSVSDLHKCLQDDQLGVQHEDQVLTAVLKWLTINATDNQMEEYSNTLMPLIRLSQCNATKLDSLVKDPDVPDCFRLKLYEYLHNKDQRKHEKARTVQPITSDPHTTPRSTIPPQTDEEAKQKTVIIGGKKTGNSTTNDIKYLIKGVKDTCITKAELCKDAVCYSVCAHADKMTVSGGWKTDLKASVSNVQMFDFTTLKWTKLPDLPHPRDSHASLLTLHKLYVMFGVTTDEDANSNHWYHEVIVLDLRRRSWSSLKNSPLALENVSVAKVDEDIFAIGGANETFMSLKTVKYSIQNNDWNSCQDMPSGAAYAVESTVVVGNRIFTLLQTDFLVYDTQQNSWTKLKAPMMPSYWCSMVPLTDTLLVMGGYKENNKTPHDRLQSYDLKTGEWSLLEETMPEPLSHYSAIVLPRRT